MGIGQLHEPHLHIRRCAGLVHQPPLHTPRGPRSGSAFPECVHAQQQGWQERRSAARKDGERSESMRWCSSRARARHHCQLQSAGHSHPSPLPWCAPTPFASASAVSPEDSRLPPGFNCPFPAPRASPETSSTRTVDKGGVPACGATCSSSLASNKYCTRKRRTMPHQKSRQIYDHSMGQETEAGAEDQIYCPCGCKGAASSSRKIGVIYPCVAAHVKR